MTTRLILIRLMDFETSSTSVNENILILKVFFGAITSKWGNFSDNCLPIQAKQFFNICEGIESVFVLGFWLVKTIFVSTAKVLVC